MKKRWIKSKEQDLIAKSLSNTLGISRMQSVLLTQRGIINIEDASTFLFPKITDLHDPFLMKDMHLAVDRILSAIRQQESILLYGDYDVDGVCSVAMFYRFIKSYTNQVDYYIPDRKSEGYGVSIKGINHAIVNGHSLIIAMDCGIKAIEAVEYAGENNIDFIICDHHQPDQTLPNALAILNPEQKSCPYPFKKLSGCGVVFKLIQAIIGANKENPEKWMQMLEYVTLATACDLVPMLGENRILVNEGLKRLPKTAFLGIAKLLSYQGLKNKIVVSDLVFKIGPVINATGRLSSAKKSVELLIEDNPDRIDKLIEEAIADNEHRKKIQASTLSEAKALWLDTSNLDHKTIILYNPRWHKGILGIVASKLTEEFQRPVILLTLSKGVLTGSARSIPNFNLYQALASCTIFLESFGGHYSAAGLSLQPNQLEDFKVAFERFASKHITILDQSPSLKIAQILALEDINRQLLKDIQSIAPFGPKNRNPMLVTKNIENVKARVLKGKHLKLELYSPKVGKIQAIGFDLGKYYDQIIKKPFHIAYSIEENIWKGESYIHLKIKDIHIIED